MQSLITNNLDRIAELCKQHHVRQLFLFGSAARDDFDPTKSDIDLRVFFKDSVDNYAENYFSLLRSLEELFGREIDLLSSPAIRNSRLRKKIEDSQELLYAA